jgi:flagella basal body P-ring formation protein FlgA
MMRRRGLRLLAVLLLLTMLVVQVSAAMELYLRDQVTAAPAGISVADVVDGKVLSGVGGDAFRQTPLSGIGSRPVLVSPTELRNQMRRIFGNSYVLVGSAVAVLPADVTDPGRRAFLEAFLARARTLMTPGTRRLEFELIDDDAAREIDSTAPVEVRIVEAERRWGIVDGVVRVAFRQMTSTGAQRSGECLLAAHHSVGVPVAARALRPGDPLHEDAVRIESKWISELAAEPVAEPAKITRFTVSRHVREGTSLSKALVRKPTLVRAGSAVTAFFSRGAVSVRLPARAQESGAADEVVRIRMPETGRRFHGVVTGASEVRVDDP